MGEVSIMLPQYQYKHLVNQKWQGGVNPLPTNPNSFTYPPQSILRHLESSHQCVEDSNLAVMLAKQGEANPQPAPVVVSSHLSKAANRNPELSHHLYR